MTIVVLRYRCGAPEWAVRDTRNIPGQPVRAAVRIHVVAHRPNLFWPFKVARNLILKALSLIKPAKQSCSVGAKALHVHLLSSAAFHGPERSRRNSSCGVDEGQAHVDV